jgi:hypothetical protein
MSDDDTTRIIARKTKTNSDSTVEIGSVGSSRPRDDDNPHTRIFRPKSAATSAAGVETNKLGDFAVEPVVGWLVVVEGPGRGRSLTLGYGMNSIGRSKDARVSLDFGDEEISRESHAMLTYDRKGQKFYIQHGGGSNLTYLGDAPVLQPHELMGREIISIGKTRLCFVPLCGPGFEWQN